MWLGFRRALHASSAKHRVRTQGHSPDLLSCFKCNVHATVSWELPVCYELRLRYYVGPIGWSPPRLFARTPNIRFSIWTSARELAYPFRCKPTCCISTLARMRWLDVWYKCVPRILKFLLVCIVYDWISFRASGVTAILAQSDVI